jgi:hypothetical protein
MTGGVPSIPDDAIATTTDPAGAHSLWDILLAYAPYCLAVAHPWTPGVWQLQCNASMRLSASVRDMVDAKALTDIAVWWD